ncbi:septum formation initiator family protein [Verrucomicrobiota bacterium]
MAKREEKELWKLINKTACIVTAAGFLILVIYLFTPKIKQYNQYQQTAEKLDAEVETLQDQIAEIQNKRRNFVHDKNYARRIAHEHGFAEKGEVIYRFLDEPAP